MQLITFLRGDSSLRFCLYWLISWTNMDISFQEVMHIYSNNIIDNTNGVIKLNILRVDGH